MMHPADVFRKEAFWQAEARARRAAWNKLQRERHALTLCKMSRTVRRPRTDFGRDSYLDIPYVDATECEKITVPSGWKRARVVGGRRLSAVWRGWRRDMLAERWEKEKYNAARTDCGGSACAVAYETALGENECVDGTDWPADAYDMGLSGSTPDGRMPAPLSGGAPKMTLQGARDMLEACVEERAKDKHRFWPSQHSGKLGMSLTNFKKKYRPDLLPVVADVLLRHGLVEDDLGSRGEDGWEEAKQILTNPVGEGAREVQEECVSARVRSLLERCVAYRAGEGAGWWPPESDTDLGQKLKKLKQAYRPSVLHVVSKVLCERGLAVEELSLRGEAGWMEAKRILTNDRGMERTPEEVRKHLEACVQAREETPGGRWPTQKDRHGVWLMNFAQSEYDPDVLGVVTEVLQRHGLVFDDFSARGAERWEEVRKLLTNERSMKRTAAEVRMRLEACVKYRAETWQGRWPPRGTPDHAWLYNFGRSAYDPDLLLAAAEVLQKHGVVSTDLSALGMEGWYRMQQVLRHCPTLLEFQDAQWKERWAEVLDTWLASGSTPQERRWPPNIKCRWLERLRARLRGRLGAVLTENRWEILRGDLLKHGLVGEYFTQVSAADALVNPREQRATKIRRLCGQLRTWVAQNSRAPRRCGQELEERACWGAWQRLRRGARRLAGWTDEEVQLLQEDGVLDVLRNLRPVPSLQIDGKAARARAKALQCAENELREEIGQVSSESEESSDDAEEEASDDAEPMALDLSVDGLVDGTCEWDVCAVRCRVVQEDLLALDEKTRHRLSTDDATVQEVLGDTAQIATAHQLGGDEQIAVMRAVDGVLQTLFPGDGAVTGAFFAHLRELYLLTRDALPLVAASLAANVVQVEQCIETTPCFSSECRRWLALEPEQGVSPSRDLSACSYGELLVHALDVGDGVGGAMRLQAMAALRKNYGERFWSVVENGDPAAGVHAWGVWGNAWRLSWTATAELCGRVRTLAAERRIDLVTSSQEFWRRERLWARNETAVVPAQVCCTRDVAVRQQLFMSGVPRDNRPVVLPGGRGELWKADLPPEQRGKAATRRHVYESAHLGATHGSRLFFLHCDFLCVECYLRVAHPDSLDVGAEQSREWCSRMAMPCRRWSREECHRVLQLEQVRCWRREELLRRLNAVVSWEDSGDALESWWMEHFGGAQDEMCTAEAQLRRGILGDNPSLAGGREACVMLGVPRARIRNQLVWFSPAVPAMGAEHCGQTTGREGFVPMRLWLLRACCRVRGGVASLTDALRGMLYHEESLWDVRYARTLDGVLLRELRPCPPCPAPAPSETLW